jgi:hypothetical protein
VHHSANILQYLIVPKSQHLESIEFQIGIALGIGDATRAILLNYIEIIELRRLP